MTTPRALRFREAQASRRRNATDDLTGETPRLSGRSRRHPATRLAPALAFLGLATTSFAEGPELDDWREKMRPIEPLAYLCRHVDSPPAIDGDLADATWADIPWTEDFVDIEGSFRSTPRFRTRAKLAWDDTALYIAAELEEPHIWANHVAHDAVIFQDPDFEVFIDPDGDTHAYTEFEMNARNTTWDLLLEKPYQDDGPAVNAYEIAGLRSTVRLHGTLNEPGDIDSGWTLEIAMPWAAFAKQARHPGPPQEGEQWRLNFSRVQWHIYVDPPYYRKVPRRPEDNWVWSPQGVIDMHRPEMWGVLQFTRQPPATPVATTPIRARCARDLVLDVYYAQRDFRKKNGHWADSLSALGWSADRARAGLELPVLESTRDAYTCSASFNENGLRYTWTIRQDRRLTLDQVPLAPSGPEAR